MSRELVLHSEERHTLPVAGWRDIFTSRNTARGLAVGVGTGVLYWASFGVWFAALGRDWAPRPPGLVAYTSASLAVALGTVLAMGRAPELVAGTPFGWGAARRFDEAREKINPPALISTRSVGPVEVWRYHTRQMVGLGMLVAFAMALFAEAFATVWFGLRIGITLGLVTGIWILIRNLLVINLGTATAITALQLAATQGTPLRLLSFLEDARRRNLLRTNGAAYQFRHSLLLERLSLDSAPQS